MHQYSLLELSQALHQRQLSSVELTQHFLDRIAAFDGQINSFITVTVKEALQQAAAADKRLETKQSTPLTGIPIAHKDVFCTAGVKTSAASKMLDNFVAPYNATVVEQCLDAGMVMLGKTNLDEFAMGSTNETSYFGAVCNPWDQAHSPGGSSGGSAAAVAAHLTPIATGTDTGGSVRQPCAFCGITGLKPTYGRISRYGMIAYASSLDQGGIMAHSAHDVAMLLNVLAQHDLKDSTSLPQSPSDFTQGISQPLSGLKVGLPREYLLESLPSEIVQQTLDAARVLEQQGATLHEVTLPHTDYATSCYYTIAPAECSSNLSRYDGIRYGYRCENPKNLDDYYRRTRSEGFGDEVKSRILTGTHVLSAGYYDAFYRKAQRIRRLIRDDFMQAFDSVDVLLTPTTPTPATPLGRQKIANENQYFSDIFTVAVNLAGLPALSMPAGFVGALPVGAQLIGPHLSEQRLLNIAHQYQQNTDWHLQRAPAFNQDKG